MELIKEIGANGIRLAHYPHSDFFYSAMRPGRYAGMGRDSSYRQSISYPCLHRKYKTAINRVNPAEL